VFVGDGESDRYGAGYSDVIFAKRALVKLCLENGWPFRRWTELAEIDAWLRALLDAWSHDPAAIPSPKRKPFFCGPEAWGSGRWDPLGPAGRPDATSGGEGVVPG
jgi:hypothetical protein